MNYKIEIDLGILTQYDLTTIDKLLKKVEYLIWSADYAVEEGGDKRFDTYMDMSGEIVKQILDIISEYAGGLEIRKTEDSTQYL